MSLIKGIHHVCLKCANEEEYKEVVHFYHEILELEIARTWSEGIMFQFGNAVLEVFANGGDRNYPAFCPCNRGCRYLRGKAEGSRVRGVCGTKEYCDSIRSGI